MLIRPLIALLKWSLLAHNTVLVILNQNYWFQQKSQRLFYSKVKHGDAAINATVSFKPEDEVEIIVQTQTVYEISDVNW